MNALTVTGIDILERSLPMFLHRRFQRLMPSVSDIGTGNFCLRPVCIEGDDATTVAAADADSSSVLLAALEAAGKKLFMGSSKV